MGHAWIVVLAYVLFKVFRTGLAVIIVWLALRAIAVDKRDAKRAAIATCVVLVIYDVSMFAVRALSL
jgi:hypothetical protein